MTIPRIFTENDLFETEEMLARGVRVVDVADHLRISRRQFDRRRKTDEALEGAVNRGMGRQYAALVGSLMARAMDPKAKDGAASAMFLLKSVHGLSDRGGHSPDNRVNVAILNLPKPLSEDQYAQLRSTQTQALEAGANTLVDVVTTSGDDDEGGAS